MIDVTTVEIVGNKFKGQRFIGDAHRVLALLRSRMAHNNLTIGRQEQLVGDPRNSAMVVATSIHGKHTAVIYTEFPIPVTKKEIDYDEGADTFIVIVEDKDAGTYHNFWLTFNGGTIKALGNPYVSNKDITVYQSDELSGNALYPFTYLTDVMESRLLVIDERIAVEPGMPPATTIITLSFMLMRLGTIIVRQKFTYIEELDHCTEYFVRKEKVEGESFYLTFLYTWQIQEEGSSSDTIYLTKRKLKINAAGEIIFTIVKSNVMSAPAVIGGAGIAYNGGWWPRCIRYVTDTVIAFNHYRMWPYITGDGKLEWFAFTAVVTEFNFVTLTDTSVLFTHSDTEHDLPKEADSIRMAVWSPTGVHTVGSKDKCIQNIEYAKRSIVPHGYKECNENNWPHDFDKLKTKIDHYEQDPATGQGQVWTLSELDEYSYITPRMDGFQLSVKYYPRYLLLGDNAVTVTHSNGQSGRGPSGESLHEYTPHDYDKIELPWYYFSDWSAAIPYLTDNYNNYSQSATSESGNYFWWYDFQEKAYTDAGDLYCYKYPYTPGDTDTLHINPKATLQHKDINPFIMWLTVIDGSINNGIAIGTDLIIPPTGDYLDYVTQFEAEVRFYCVDSRGTANSTEGSILHFYKHVDKNEIDGWTADYKEVGMYMLYRRQDRTADIKDALKEYIIKYINPGISDDDWRILGVTLR